MNSPLVRGALAAAFLVLCLASDAHAAAVTAYWPVSGSATPDAVDKPFGFRRLSSSGTPEFHQGIDVDVPAGTPVYAVFSGTVVRVRHDDTNPDHLHRWGKYIVIALDPVQSNSGETLSTHKVAYLHLGEVDSNLAENSTVTRGQYLGRSGSSGQGINTEHLHFNYYQGSSDKWIRRAEARNPLEILPHSSVVPTVSVTVVSDSTLRVSIDQHATSMDIVGFRVGHNGWSSFHGADPIEIDFNEKVGINMTAPEYEDLNPFQGTTFLPVYFANNPNDTAPDHDFYTLILEFDGDWSQLDFVSVRLTNAHDVAYLYAPYLPPNAPTF